MCEKKTDPLLAGEDALERGYLQTVLTQIARRKQALDGELTTNRRELTEAREQMWEDETQLVRSFDDVVTLSQMQQEMGTSQARYYDKLRERRLLDRLAESPYFGRVDFVELDFVENDEDTPAAATGDEEFVSSVEVSAPYTIDPNNPPEAFYIGAGSLAGDDALTRLVYDWRTPIASLFYEQGLGHAAYRCPSGTMEGQLTRKRQFGIENGVLQYWFDTDAKIDDELLGRVLAGGAATHLKTIVKSIQREQNKAIRAGIAQDLLVFGPAGSGKTSVGLHRCAWLLYHYRDKITPTNLLVLSTSGIFADYLTGVLPELGEQELRRTILSSLVTPLIPPDYTAEDRYDQMEYLIERGGKPDARGIEAKSGIGFLNYLRKRMHELPLSVEAVTVFDETICTEADLAPLVLPDPRGTTATRIERLRDTLTERVHDYFELHMDGLVLKLRKSNETVLFEDEIPILMLKLRNATLNGALDRFLRRNALDAVGLYRSFLADYLAETGADKRVLRETEASIASKRLRYEDLLPICVIRLLLGEGTSFPQIVHIVLDEAQDFGVFQHQLVRLLFPKAKFTVLADPAQRIAADGVDRAALIALYPNARVDTLGKSYRSTAPIAHYALQYLTEDDRYECFDRAGEEPKEFVGDPAEIIPGLVDKEVAAGCRSLCVLTRSVAEAKSLAKRLPTLAALVESDDTLPGKPVLLPLAFAKGLEFDAVILLDDGLGSPQACYVMATRALHRLYIVKERK